MHASRLEVLENRRLLSSVSFVDGILTIIGDATADTLISIETKK